jgi:hypothetical protein
MSEHWIFARELLAVLTAFLYGYDRDGMELYFSSSRKHFGPFHEPKEFVDAMDKMRPKPTEAANRGEALKQPEFGSAFLPSTIVRSGTQSTASSTGETDADDIRTVLNELINAWRKQYKKHLTVIILTDGVWPSVAQKKTVTNLITTHIEMWKDQKKLKKELDERGLSFQFVRFGDNKEAIDELDRMDNYLMASDNTSLP